ncbi:hypothetical protein F2P81_008382 [Scophthalmus maximus]|uniref:Uncharacterized protein n=1 Tax=Scophthalmus maximus TaxID=52904 RepID=A0A6A4T247_SCOMX|nr:hypothetical protein F2P81_008382 [Scophthalmus maximus]
MFKSVSTRYLRVRPGPSGVFICLLMKNNNKTKSYAKMFPETLRAASPTLDTSSPVNSGAVVSPFETFTALGALGRESLSFVIRLDSRSSDYSKLNTSTLQVCEHMTECG